MSGERLLASYIVRVAVRDGHRQIYVHDLATGTTSRLEEFAELGAHLAAREDASTPDDASEEERRSRG